MSAPRFDEPIDFFDPTVIYLTELARQQLEESFGVSGVDAALRTAVELVRTRGVLLAVRRIPERFKAEYKEKHGIDTTRYFTLVERRVLLPVRVNVQDTRSPWVAPTARSLDDGDRAYLRSLERLAGVVPSSV